MAIDAQPREAGVALGQKWPRSVEMCQLAQLSAAPSLGSCGAFVPVSHQTRPSAYGGCRDLLFVAFLRLLFFPADPAPVQQFRAPEAREELNLRAVCFASGNSGGKSAFPLGSALLALLPWLLFLLCRIAFGML